MKESELQYEELSRIIDLSQRLELLKVWLQKGYKRTLAQRRDAWTTVEREAAKQLITFQPVAVPQETTLPMDEKAKNA